ncbi:hypothetical protein [Gordonia mangrovi]|uniref:hypothetical protein n=1 Tax=Gordonia mangrovi TaxID=2665643 RepID=UPI001F3616CE|nr:hypothetical protein [Gordonia mangrovi]UVF80232.1 hypothetical protein NWF22_10570 [Gordonia mangrovi]
MVLDAVVVDGPVLVVGHSLASLYVEGFGRVHPERSAGLVVVDGSFVMAPWKMMPSGWGVSMGQRAVEAARGDGRRGHPRVAECARLVPGGTGPAGGIHR